MMAKITDLAAVEAINGDEFLPIVQQGATKRATMSALRALIVPFLQQWYKGDKGDPGAAGNVAATIAQLQGAPLSAATMIAAYDGTGSTMTWTTGDFTAQAGDRPADYVKSNAQPISAGAWVRQRADSLQYTAALIPAPSRPVNRVLDDFPTLPSLGVVPGRDNSVRLAELMAKARELAMGTANPPRIRVPSGIYSYETAPNFAVQGLTLDCEPGAVFSHTGTGIAFPCDGGATGGGVGMMKVQGGLVIRGNPKTTDGLWNRAIHDSRFDVEVQHVTDAVLRTNWVVCNEYWIRHSPIFRPGFPILPKVGAFLSRRDVGERTSRCTFHNTRISSVDGYCWNFDDAIVNTVSGGTSESSVAGMFFSDLAICNIIAGHDIEFNTLIDIFCLGVYNSFQGGIFDGKSEFRGLLNTVTGGLYDSIINSGIANDFGHINYGIAGGDFLDTGVDTVRRHIRHALGGLEPDLLKREVGLQQYGRIGRGLVVGRADLVNGGSADDIVLARQAGGSVLLSSPTGDRVGWSANGLGFNDRASMPISKPAVSGSIAGNSALGSLIEALAAYGLIVDSTTA